MRRTLLILGLSAGAIPAQGQTDSTAARDTTPPARTLAVVRVTGRIDNLAGIASSASAGRIGSSDLRLRPLLREGELLETVPGLIVTQHSGDGKANQLFVRGFNLDHGTDFQTRLEGMPVNNPSHAHGQGYTDLNFLIPELVDHIDYKLGVHHASQGDFGSAGGAEFHLKQSLTRPLLTFEAGAFGFARLVAARSARLGAGTLLLAGEGKTYDGPWQVDQQLRKRSVMARYTRGAPTAQLSLLALGYRNSWDASDQIPLRTVRAGTVSRFGQLDQTLGGATARYSLSGSYRRIGNSSQQLVQLFGIKSSLDLYSNFTYQLDAGWGDQFNQREDRTAVGVNADHRQQARVFNRDHALRFGLQNRVDLLDDVGLHRTRSRQRLGTVRQDDVVQSSTGLFVEAESRWSSRWRTVLGVRSDVHTFDVSSDNPANSGNETGGIMSPKASLVFAPRENLELYLSGGLGFHSNDARGTTITVDPVTHTPAGRVDPLVRSRGGELGLRVSTESGFRSTLTLWGLDLDSELLFVGDGGTTEPSGRSRRAGVTFANFYRPLPSLSLDADVSVASARFTGVEENRIPGALENVVAAGATWGGDRRGPFGALRLRHFGSYPLTEDNTVRATGTTLLNGDVGLQLASVRLQLTVLNLLNTRARDIQYFYASRLAGEPVDGVADVHFHPVEPRQLRVSVRW